MILLFFICKRENETWQHRQRGGKRSSCKLFFGPPCKMNCPPDAPSCKLISGKERKRWKTAISCSCSLFSRCISLHCKFHYGHAHFWVVRGPYFALLSLSVNNKPYKLEILLSLRVVISTKKRISSRAIIIITRAALSSLRDICIWCLQDIGNDMGRGSNLFFVFSFPMHYYFALTSFFPEKNRTQLTVA